jgi:hypothetical protein
MLAFAFLKAVDPKNVVKTGWGFWGTISRVMAAAFPFLLVYALYTTKALG